MMTDEREDQDRNRSFSLPPLGGGLVPEMKLNLNPSGGRSLEVAHSVPDDGKQSPIKVPPSFFESTDHLDLSALSGAGAKPITGSGLDIDHRHSDPTQGVPASFSLSDEETLPLDSVDDLQTGKRPERQSMPSRKSVDRRALWLVPLVLLLAVAAAFQLKLGPFSRKSDSPARRDAMPTSPKPTEEAITEQEKALLNLDYKMLLEASQGDEMIACESALVLAWFYHEFETLEACKKFLQTPINATGDAQTRRFQFFRALFLNQRPRPA
jgi:hypothetical protein